MMNVYQKSELFFKALLDVFEDEEHESTEERPKIPVEDSDEDDFTAMLIAMKDLYDPEETIDLIAFTHLLNRFAVEQTMLESCCQCYAESEEALALAKSESTIQQ